MLILLFYLQGALSEGNDMMCFFTLLNNISAPPLKIMYTLIYYCLENSGNKTKYDVNFVNCDKFH